MTVPLPEKFLERLGCIIPSEEIDAVLQTFSKQKTIVFRLNRCHIDHSSYKETFEQLGLPVQQVKWFTDAYILQDRLAFDQLLDAEKQGLIYRQSLSSMLAAVLLNVQPGHNVLDVCAAPGSKTTLLAAEMNNYGQIVAIEAIKNRYYKLKTVLNLMQVDCVNTLCMDGRRYRPMDLQFDRILVDAPCSSEGRFSIENKKSFGYWSIRKIREMRKKQKGLLLNAGRCLRPGGRMIYSTCTFAPEENEAVIDWFLRKNEQEIQIVPLELPEGVFTYPSITEWNKKEFDSNVTQCKRVLPTEQYDGFFITAFERQG